MNATLEAPPIIKAGADRTFTENARAGVRRVFRLLIFVWKYGVGMLLCQSLVGAVVVVGWTYRLMQRMAWRRWWERSDLRRNGGHFQPFVESDETTAGQARWPNWLVQPTVAAGAPTRGVRRWVASLWANVRAGVPGIFNTWVLTLPGCLLMAFSWYDGWNNSFNKGYEQAIVGPLTGVTGLLLFLLAMFYVPLAQARQAVTGEWTSFYDFRLIGRLIVRRWPACLGLAILYSLASVPVQVLRVLPEFFPQFAEQSPAYVATLPAAAIAADLNSYFFWSAAYLFPAYVMLRIIAARIYATGLLGAVEAGIISPDDLRARERAVLVRLNLLQARPGPPRHRLIQLAARGARRLLAAGALLAMLLVWFSFGAQIYIAQFLHYLGGAAWLNQPLVQLPWIRFIPAALN